MYIKPGKILSEPHLYALERAHLCPIEYKPARGDRLSRLERVRERARKLFHFLANGQIGVKETAVKRDPGVPIRASLVRGFAPSRSRAINFTKIQTLYIRR